MKQVILDFLTRKLDIINDHSNADYSVRNKTIHRRGVLRSNLCNYNDAYI